MDMDRYAAAAREALNFIEAQREGAIWRWHDDPKARANHSLYNGAGGVALLLLELHAGSPDPDLLAKATAAGDEILAYVASGPEISVNPSRGWASYLFVLNELAKATGEERFRKGAVACLDRIEQAARPLGAGVGWVEPAPFADITGFSDEREIYDQSVGAAGVILNLVYAHREGLDERALPLALAAGERLLEVAESDPDGLRWRLMSDMPFAFTAPNFAHGGAGVAYFLAELYKATGDERFLAAAKEGARYVLSRASSVGDGRLVCHTEEARTPIFYLGACHGPAGTGRLFLELYKITGETQWLEEAKALTRGLLSLGAPETRSKGLWNNHGQCCGDAGVGEYALLMARRTGDEAYLDLARRCAAVIVANSVVDGDRRRWVQSEHRDRPEFLQAQTGYMQGAAGIASFLIHLDTALAGQPVKIALPDWPQDIG